VIITVTPNAAVDKTLTVPNFQTGFRHRASESLTLPGGKGVNIARALTCRPAVLVCDEAVSALDASVQAGILNLLLRIRSERGLTIIFISHDMEVVRHVSDRVAIMDEGRIVEEGKAEKIYKDPQHKATRILIESMHIKKGA